MRKLIVSMNVTLDGFMAGPHCELDWHFRHWDAEMGDTLAAELYRADCLLLGRNTFCGMMKHWQNLAKENSISRADTGFFCQVADCNKVVCTNTLATAGWKNSKIISGNIKIGVQKLKATKGKNIIVYGSGQLVSLLWHEQLIDELQLWFHPVLLGSGKKLFQEGQELSVLNLESVKQFTTGVVLARYNFYVN